MRDHKNSSPRVIIFDIDGTLANVDHRLHHLEQRKKNWDAFFAESSKDLPHDEIVYLNRLLWDDGGNHIVIVTGRADDQRSGTIAWLERHEIRYHDIYFRRHDDHREDSVVKAGILRAIRQRHGEPYMVFEDRSRVVKMWRDSGIKCLQVAPGDF
ncbi:MAG: polynucleotide kinase [Alphaproteobacteria bacterium]|nr:polynucleotide kinase [Alphaproteobacteria bacterium]